MHNALKLPNLLTVIFERQKPIQKYRAKLKVKLALWGHVHNSLYSHQRVISKQNWCASAAGCNLLWLTALGFPPTHAGSCSITYGLWLHRSWCQTQQTSCHPLPHLHIVVCSIVTGRWHRLTMVTWAETSLRWIQIFPFLRVTLSRVVSCQLEQKFYVTKPKKKILMRT